MKKNIGNILAIIPARGGSKGVPKKNIYNINGKPLISYTIETALKVKNLLHRVIVSTDDLKIAEISKKFGADVPFIRPKNLSRDETPMIPVLQHAVNFIEKKDKILLDWVLLLQPTDPLRTVKDIIGSIEIAVESNCDSVISVERVYSHHPVLMKKIINNRLKPFFLEELEGTPRQKYEPPAYMRNGCIYLTKRDILMKSNSIWGEESLPMIMDEGARISIDTLNDMKLAELKIKN